MKVKPFVINQINEQSNCPSFAESPCEELLELPSEGTDPEGKRTARIIKLRQLQYKECKLKVDTLHLCKG